MVDKAEVEEWQKQIKQKIIRGEREYQEGKTMVVDSPRQLLNR